MRANKKSFQEERHIRFKGGGLCEKQSVLSGLETWVKP